MYCTTEGLKIRGEKAESLKVFKSKICQVINANNGRLKVK